MKCFNKQLVLISSIILVAMSCILQLHAMETKATVTLKIYPYDANFKLNNKVIKGLKITTLVVSSGVNVTFFDHKTIKIDSTDTYPLFCVRKINGKVDQFTILRYEINETDPIEINLPEDIKMRLLQYLSSDLGDKNKKNNDFIFQILNIKLNKFKPITGEHELKAGDGVILFSKLQDITDNLCMLDCYFALALGNGLYISKISDGGYLIVSTLDFLKQITLFDTVAKMSLPNQLSTIS